jgi:hypothetical protein
VSKSSSISKHVKYRCIKACELGEPARNMTPKHS